MKHLILIIPIILLFFFTSCLDSNDPPGIDNTADIEYLEQNAQQEGVTVTNSGLQYRVLQEGGGVQPTLLDTVVVHYTGELVSGEVFDSSVERGEPATFPVDGLIEGFTEGLLLMNTGSIYELVIPAYLGYGNNYAGAIYPGATLIFEVQLLEILGLTDEEEEEEEEEPESEE
jgi:FKBP-type peptidyl-prolyl cis-trans isomerase FkpA